MWQCLLCFRFIRKILFLLPKVHGEFKSNCLQIIHSRVTSIENLFVELKNKNILDILSYRYVAKQQKWENGVYCDVPCLSLVVKVASILPGPTNAFHFQYCKCVKMTDAFHWALLLSAISGFAGDPTSLAHDNIISAFSLKT